MTAKLQSGIKIAIPTATPQPPIKLLAPATVDVQVIARAAKKDDCAAIPLMPPLYTGPVSIDALSTVAFTLPVFMRELHSYYLTADDELMGLEHYLLTTGEEYAARILIRNNVDSQRIITIRWF